MATSNTAKPMTESMSTSAASVTAMSDATVEPAFFPIAGTHCGLVPENKTDAPTTVVLNDKRATIRGCSAKML
jgi:hypothetical protein